MGRSVRKVTREASQQAFPAGVQRRKTYWRQRPLGARRELEVRPQATWAKGPQVRKERGVLRREDSGSTPRSAVERTGFVVRSRPGPRHGIDAPSLEVRSRFLVGGHSA